MAAALQAGTQRAWPLGLAVAAAALAVSLSLQLSARLALVAVCVAAYLPSFLDGAEFSGERYWPWFAAWTKRYVYNIPATIEYEQPLAADRQYILCSHPHGLTSAHHGLLLSGASEPSFHDAIPMSNRRHLAASVCFRIPFYREYLLWLGCVDARRSIATKMLKEGKSIVILVGGIAEQMLAQRGDHTIYVKKRKGHIRLALQYGVPIVPGYAFGENDLYTHSGLLLSFRRAVAKRFSFAILVGYGASKWLPFLPHEGVAINQVFGKPIEVERTPEPTAEDVEKLHDKYVTELVRLFDTYKDKYGYKGASLQVV